MRKYLLLIFLLSGVVSNAQTPDDIRKIKEKSQPEALAKYASFLKDRYNYQREYGLKL